jgi:hypothetical protein
MVAASAASMAAQHRRMRRMLFTTISPMVARMCITISDDSAYCVVWMLVGDVSHCHELAVPSWPGISGTQERDW